MTNTCFSQWYEAPFTYENHTYLTAEHFMMVEKAKLFNDPENISRILTADHPRKVKSLGRQIKHFDAKVWDEHKFDIVVRGNYEKFMQNTDLRDFLLNTHNCIIVEASPYDTIWGIGIDINHPDIENPNTWRGQNLLGYALMEVRRKIASTSI